MATAADRSRAANISWARTPDRTERTRPGHRASPLSYDYWLNKVNEEGIVRPRDRAKAAENYWRAYQQMVSKKAAEARQAKAAARNP